MTAGLKQERNSNSLVEKGFGFQALVIQWEHNRDAEKMRKSSRRVLMWRARASSSLDSQGNWPACLKISGL